MPLQQIEADNARALQDIADAITKSHKILVVTGAGISTSCGIPDFRSKDGLYNLIPEQHIYPTPPSSAPSTPSKKRKAPELDEELPSSQSSVSSTTSRKSSTSPAARMKGQDLFHARVFQNSDTTEVFYQFIASLRQKIIDDVKETSATHKFIRTLRDGGRLMRCYTQNIDGLEAREGLCLDLTRGKGNKRRFMKKHIESPRPENIQGTDFDGGCEVVQLHGELSRLRCTMCSIEEDWTDESTELLLEGSAPECEKCSTKSEERQATGKRGLTVGGLRPNIVLYGEEHPQNTLLSPFIPYDVSSNPEVLIIMGTSLKVHGLQKIIREFAKAVHAQNNGKVIFVNRTRPAESVWDGIIDDFVAMDCDDWVNDLRLRREDLWLRQGDISLNMKESKPNAIKTNKKRKSAIDVQEDKENTCSMPVKKKVRVAQKSVTSAEISGFKTTKFRGQDHTIKLGGSQTPSRRLLSPKRPVTSPLTPTFSPLTPKTSSRINNSLTLCTPSKLRIITNAKKKSNINHILQYDDDQKENVSARPASQPAKSVVTQQVRERMSINHILAPEPYDENHTRDEVQTRGKHKPPAIYSSIVDGMHNIHGEHHHPSGNDNRIFDPDQYQQHEQQQNPRSFVHKLISWMT